MTISAQQNMNYPCKISTLCIVIQLARSHGYHFADYNIFQLYTALIQLLISMIKTFVCAKLYLYISLIRI